MQHRSILLKCITAIVLCFLCAPGVFAQIDPPDPSIPVDGGLALLLAAGAAYGGKKLFDRQKNHK